MLERSIGSEHVAVEPTLEGPDAVLAQERGMRFIAALHSAWPRSKTRKLASIRGGTHLML